MPATCRNRVAVPPGVPPWHHRVTLPPGAPPRHHSATVPSGAPTRHHPASVPHGARSRHYRATVLAPYRHDTSTYLRTVTTHIAYFTTHLTAVNHTSVPSDIVWRNFTILIVAKNSQDYCNGIFRRTICIAIIISQYYAIRKSKINQKFREWVRNCSCFRWICCMNMSNKWIIWTHHIFLYFRTFDIFTERSIGFRHNGWVWVNDN